MPVSISGANDDNVIFDAGKSELDRLRLQHVMIKDHMRDLIIAPIDLSKRGLRILDQATADGEWLRDVRRAAPVQHEYVGTDIVDSYFPVNPLPGMSFHHQSMTEPWPENWNGTFDLVHSRFALPGAGMKSIRDVVMNLVRLVKQGGYIQLVEVDIEDPPKNGPGMRLFGQVFRDVLKLISAGQGMDLRHDTRAWLNEAGIVDIEERLYSIPLGAKARSEDMKKISVESIISTAQGFVELFKELPPLSVSQEELQNMPIKIQRELQDIGGIFQIFVVWGRRP